MPNCQIPTGHSPSRRPVPGLPPALGIDGGPPVIAGPDDGGPELLHRVVEHSSDALVVIDPDGIIRYANPAALRLFGRGHNELVHSPFGFPLTAARTEIDVLPPERPPRVAEMAVAGIPWQGRTGYLASLRDITERKRLEHDLRLSDRIFENAAEGLLITGADNRVLRANAAVTEITGIGAGELLGSDILGALAPARSEALAGEVHRALAAGRRWQGEIASQRPDGSTFVAWVNVIGVRDSEAPNIRNNIVTITDVTRWKAAEQRLDYLAHFDPLTGVPNRAALEEHLALSLARRRTDRMLAVLFLDIDGFKRVNDAYGHDTGDRLLAHFATTLRNTLRDGDFVARLGGDEFTIVLEDIRELRHAVTVAEKLLYAMDSPVTVNGHTFRVGTSIGIALAPGDGEDGHNLIRAADMAMYRAKSASGDTYAISAHRH
ncbi:hypothetical protein KBTX_00388 [wastewater metagenome]|uniref:Uncharacterized protein n=2 Tax=unclassified sequences TaxID=12908 RepID=A0A5B8RBD8_9ZZZZ|nr:MULTISPECIES: diguanylate cyclase [Arhodomonas]MCS4504645.1 diguanylate cyclase [Arhodomonas aquaeolei]QEA04085.1 hypothetical protein KBTEX_00388 [uncultured organism]